MNFTANDRSVLRLTFLCLVVAFIVLVLKGCSPAPPVEITPDTNPIGDPLLFEEPPQPPAPHVIERRVREAADIPIGGAEAWGAWIEMAERHGFSHLIGLRSVRFAGAMGDNALQPPLLPAQYHARDEWMLYELYYEEDDPWTLHIRDRADPLMLRYDLARKGTFTEPGNPDSVVSWCEFFDTEKLRAILEECE